MVGLTILIILLSYYVPQTCIGKKYEDMASGRMVHCTGWYFLMLLEIYYSGALTMFFCTEMTIPLESMRQVMHAYPDWKLQLGHGMQVFFVYKVEDGDPDYVAFWDRVENLPDETVFE